MTSFWPFWRLQTCFWTLPKLELTINDEIPWHLATVLAAHRDTEGNQKLSAIVHLPSGVKPKMIKAWIVAGGTALKMQYPFPACMLNARAMFAAFEQVGVHFGSGHAREIAHNDETKKFRRCSNDSVLLTSRITLPFTVEEQFFNSPEC